MKRCTTSRCVCPCLAGNLLQDSECCTAAAYLANTPAETCGGKISPSSLRFELIWCLFFLPGFSSLPFSILSLAEVQD